MYSVGDYVVKVNDGVCQIEEITHLKMSGVDNDKLYYLLLPVHNKDSRIFVPVEGKTEGLRLVVTPDVANEIMKKVPGMEVEWNTSNKLREIKYKEVLRGGDLECMLGYIKSMHQKRQERESQGKKNTAMDERYLKMMEDAVYTEFAFSLGCEKAEVKERVLKMF